MTEPTCRIVRPGGTYAGAQGFDYFEGISAQTTGSHGICMHLLTIPPGGAAKPHLHEQHETAIYMLSGVTRMKYGDGPARPDGSERAGERRAARRRGPAR